MTQVKIAVQEYVNAPLSEVALVYHATGYQSEINPQDTLVLAHRHQHLVGVVRLCPEMGFTVLRGMRVLPAYQRQGIGTSMLYACAQWLANQVCYCIAWNHLRDFYGQVGFHQVTARSIPQLLQDRYASYLTQSMQVSLLVREAV